MQLLLTATEENIMSYRPEKPEKRPLFTSTAATIVIVSTMLIIAITLSTYIMVKLFA